MKLPKKPKSALTFQSTQPKRAATKKWVVVGDGPIFQSTQPKRAATYMARHVEALLDISIHAAQEGCDGRTAQAPRATRGFQSTQPKRAATEVHNCKIEAFLISIHAAQEGCDSPRRYHPAAGNDFNPRSPRGLRLFLH